MRDRATKSAIRSNRKRIRRAKERKEREEKERSMRDTRVIGRYGIAAHYTCGRKVKYESKEEAMSRALESVAHGAPKLRAYRCPYCDGWHLTKKSECE